MKLFSTILFLFLNVSNVFPQNSISPEVIKKSNVLILNDEMTFTIEDVNKSSLSRKYDVIILNKFGTSKKDIVLNYSKFSKIKDASVIHLSADNKVIKKYKLKDFQDWSTDFSSVASDSRAKLLEITHQQYPYRIQVEYEQEFTGSLFYPAWRPQSWEKEYVQKAIFKVINKSGNTFRYYPVNSGEPEKILSDDGAEIFTWSLSSLAPVEFESFNYNADEYFPTVYTAPEKFVMDGFEGDLSTWASFGEWINKLNAGKNDLSEEQLSEVKALISTEDTDLEKVKKVYEYLQSKTRYVSIQLGIGGWQPFDASFVHEKKYGDCKALSFYTKTLLEAVGIKSHYTLIKAGTYEQDLIEEFPFSHFNHAIVTVPMKKDTIWLECTSQTNPFGYLGTFTSGRKALMITEKGGQVIKTKDYTADENIQITTGNIRLKEDGTAEALIQRNYRGLELENDGFKSMLLKPKSEQDKWFYDELDWGTFKIKDYTLEDINNELIPAAGFTTNVEIKNAGSPVANRMFFAPARFSNINYLKLNQEQRSKGIEIRYPYTQYDSMILTPPMHFHIESNLNDELKETPYGVYSRKIIENRDGEFLYIRKFILKKGSYPAEEYNEFREFIRDVQKYDRQRLVFVNKT